MTAVLLERDELLARLHSLEAATRNGEGRVVAVTGEAGQGKTTLLRHFVAGLRSGSLLLESGCDPLTTPSPLAPLHEVAQRLGLTADDLTKADRGAVFASTLQRLGEHAPCVWVIEDVHWADGATLDLVRFIGRRIDRTSSLLVLSYRSDELGPNHPVRAVVGDLSRSTSVERIRLEPMSVDAVGVLCGAERAERIHAITGGNAFFVTEIAAGSDEVVPASVRDAVAARAARLPDDVRQVVEAVSIAPRSMPFETIDQVVDVDEDVMTRVTTSGMLVMDDHGLRFRHELARQTIEQSIQVPTRRRLHLRYLDVLVAEHGGDHARLAHHAVRSGDAARIVEHCRPAARDAAERLAFREASDLISASLRHRRALTSEDLVNDLALYTEAMCGANRAALVGDATADLLAVAEQSGDPTLLTTALLAIGRQRYAAGDPNDARDIADRAIDAAGRCGDDTLLADALIRRANLAMLARDASTANELLERALPIVGQAEHLLEAQALNALGCVEIGMGGDIDRGMHLLRQSLAIGERLEHHATVSLALVNLGTGAGEVRRYGDAVDWLERAIRSSEARDADYTALYVRAWLARVRFERGEWGAVDDAVGVNDSAARFSSSTLTREGTRGRVAVRRGDEGAAELLRELVTTAGSSDLQHLWPPLCGLAEAEWLAGRENVGRDLLRQPYERALATDSPWAQGEIGWWLQRCGGDVRTSERDETPFDQHLRGDWEGAAARWQAIGCPYEEALARADGPADSKLRALSIFDRLGAVPAASWLRRLLRADGIDSIPRGPRRTTSDNPAGLTVRQAEVLELAAVGMTNAEIATRLFVSRKTVEHHMSAVFSKLGVSSRREAAERAATWPDRP